MKCWLAAIAALAAAACAGCGTVQNFTVGWKGRTEPYGGVNIAVNRMKKACDVEQTVRGGLYVFDTALSAIGDTVMLPVTLPIAGIHAIEDSICDYYFPDVEPEPAVDDKPSHLTPERIHGGII